MNKGDLRWHFTFNAGPFDNLTVEEGHPDFLWLRDKPESKLVSAALIDMTKFSNFDTEEEQVQAVVASISLPPSRLIRVFRKVEWDLIYGTQHRIPAFQYRTQIDKDMYCFVMHGKAVLTDDRRHTREIWNG